jgi:hypothetical protein
MMEIRVAKSRAERAAAYALAEREYGVRGYAERLDPLDAPGTEVIVAVQDAIVIGTVSLAGAADGSLPTAKYFGLHLEDESPGLEPQGVMEAGRRAIALSRRSPAALYGLLAAMVLWGTAHSSGCVS